MYSASQRTLDAEQKLRQQLEQEIETQKSIRQEKEVSAVWDEISAVWVELQL